MRYILNSAVITTFGTYSYLPLTLDEAKEWLRRGEFLSTVGYQETADALYILSGVVIPVNRKIIKMSPGDEALVFRVTLKPGDDRLQVALKGSQGVDFLLSHCEIGLLVRVDEGDTQ